MSGHLILGVVNLIDDITHLFQVKPDIVVLEVLVHGLYCRT